MDQSSYIQKLVYFCVPYISPAIACIYSPHPPTHTHMHKQKIYVNWDKKNYVTFKKETHVYFWIVIEKNNGKQVIYPSAHFYVCKEKWCNENNNFIFRNSIIATNKENKKYLWNISGILICKIEKYIFLFYMFVIDFCLKKYIVTINYSANIYCIGYILINIINITMKDCVNIMLFVVCQNYTDIRKKYLSTSLAIFRMHSQYFFKSGISLKVFPICSNIWVKVAIHWKFLTIKPIFH